MKLQAYIDAKGITVAEAARQLKKSQQTVDLWAKEQRIPRKSEMTGIYRWSNGEVQPNDFYPLTAEDDRANGLDPHPVLAGAAA
ncbi:MAG: hypothetical protein PSY14_06805 [bacterium]|nr:hypothetical protein [bacterium]